MRDVSPCPWDADFIDLVHPQGGLFELTKLANQLDMQPLLKLACAKVAALKRDVDDDQLVRARLVRPVAEGPEPTFDHLSCYCWYHPSPSRV